MSSPLLHERDVWTTNESSKIGMSITLIYASSRRPFVKQLSGYQVLPGSQTYYTVDKYKRKRYGRRNDETV